MKTLIKNCHLISPDVDLLNAAILIDGEDTGLKPSDLQ